MAELQVLPPGYQSQIDEAQFKKRLSAALAASGAQQLPTGRMIGNRFVPTSNWENVNQLAKSLLGAYGMYSGEKQQTDALNRYGTDQTAEVNKVLQMQLPRQETLPGGPGEGDAGVSSITRPGDVRGAEVAGLGSQFPQARAIGEALQKARLLAEEKRREELLKRVRLRDIQAGNLEGGAAKLEFGVTEGVPYAESEEGILPLGRYTQGTMTGAEGKPMAVQTAPFTGKVDAIDKAPKVSTTVNAGKDEEPYWKQFAKDIGEQDAKTVQIARAAEMELPSIQALRKAHIDAKGNWTGGPIAGPIRLIRDTFSQLNIPLDPTIDLNNAKMQALMMSKITEQILGQGRGLTDEDVKRLEKTFPTDKITPAMFPAFLTAYEAALRRRATVSEDVRKRIEAGSKGKMPTVLRPPPGLPTKPISEMSAEELDAYEAAKGR